MDGLDGWMDGWPLTDTVEEEKDFKKDKRWPFSFWLVRTLDFFQTPAVNFFKQKWMAPLFKERKKKVYYTT